MLTAVYIKGFKTFARPVRMPLEGGVTAIVGPNGSGKSNVTDAVLFALGEQRPGLLRAGSMSDLIFSGSDSLAGARVAEVTLALDNSDGTISLPYREVSITRRVSREGDSEYRINGSRSRLADVRSIAGELGIGHHSILRQGAVDSIVTGGAAACRNALEEAAGLGVYRRRRVTASRRLERADDQLEQSRQLEASLTEQLQRIEKEAVAAREYRELETRYREISLAHLYRVASQGLEERRAKLCASEALVGELEGRERSLEKRRSEIEESLRELDGRSREFEGRIQGLESASEGLQRGSLQAERARFRLQEARRSEEERARLAGRLRRELERTEVAISKLEAEAATMEEEHSGRQADLEKARAELSRAREAQAEAESRSARAKRDLGTLRSRRDKSAAGAVGEGMQQTPGDEDIRRISETVSALEGGRVSSDLRARLRKIGELAGKHRARADEFSSSVTKRRGRLDAVIGGAETVIRSLSPAEREDRSTVTRLHEVIRASPGFERAVQAALGEIAGGVLARDVDEALSLLEDEEPVAVRLDAREIEEAGVYSGRPLTDCVEVLDDRHGDALRRLLAGIYVVDHPRASMPQNGHVAVTREGLKLTRTSASNVPLSEEGEFVRGARLEAERRRVEALREGPESDLDSLGEQISAAAEWAREVSRQTGAADVLAERAERAGRAISSGASRRLERLQRERERIEARQQETERLDHEISSTEEALREADLAGEKSGERLERAASGEKEARLVHEELEWRLSRTREALREGCSRREAIAAELGRSEEGLGAHLGAVAGISDRVVEASGAALDAVRKRLGSLRESREEISAERRQFSEAREELSGEATGLASELATARAETQQLREELARSEASASEAEEEISSEWGADLETARSEHDRLDSDTDTGAERSRLSRRLNRFGDVNLLALSQEGELRERHDFVASQRADAEAAAGELSVMIREIDTEIETRFGEMFSRVKEAFGNLVPRMMEGSTGELDLSEEGVEIGVRLGRRGHRPLNVLSGGERSLLALSFLFSIFLSRTGHEAAGDARAFCILDEAEAALDDLNLARFLSVVDSYRSTGQFLLVTHQKRTMAAADVLYGVTQDTSGATTVVSKRLSGD